MLLHLNISYPPMMKYKKMYAQFLRFIHEHIHIHVLLYTSVRGMLLTLRFWLAVAFLCARADNFWYITHLQMSGAYPISTVYAIAYCSFFPSTRITAGFGLSIRAVWVNTDLFRGCSVWLLLTLLKTCFGHLAWLGSSMKLSFTWNNRTTIFSGKV